MTKIGDPMWHRPNLSQEDVDDILALPLDHKDRSFSDAILCDLDLSGKDLRSVDFRGSTLKRVNFKESLLLYSTFRSSGIASCDFSRAELFKVDISDSVMQSCSLRNTNLVKANLQNSIIEGCDIDQDTNFSGANITGITGTEMHSVDNIGTYKGNAIFLPEYDRVYAGCWKGSLDDFLIKGKHMNRGDSKAIKAIIAAYDYFKVYAQEEEK